MKETSSVTHTIAHSAAERVESSFGASRRCEVAEPPQAAEGWWLGSH